MGHLRIAVAALRTPRQPAALHVDAHPAGTCTIGCRGQRLLTTGFAAARVGRPAEGSRHTDGRRQHLSRALLGSLVAESATANVRMNTGLTEQDSSDSWEDSCRLNPTQLEAGLQLASCAPHQAPATVLSQAAAISVPAARSGGTSVMVCGGSAAAVTALPAAGHALTCRGVILLPAGAHASTEQQSALVPALEGVGPVSRRVTGPAALRGLRGMPRTARLLRIEALVRHRPERDCSTASTGLGLSSIL